MNVAVRAALAALTLAAGCGGGRMGSERDAAAVLREVPATGLEKVAGKRIWFGHQSVGYDVVGGLEALVRERPELRLRIAEGRSPEPGGGAAFLHARNGKNHEPLGKIREFARALETDGLGGRLDIAFFKFCFVDFEAGSDVEKVFAEYRSTMARLHQAFPGLKLVHVTVPLTRVQSGPKALVKRVLGRRLGGAAENVARERFNALLRSEYGGREPLFDLAAAEATRLDGTRETFADGGSDHPALVPEYASDEGHLNAAGARWAAAHLLRTLSAAAE